MKISSLDVRHWILSLMTVLCAACAPMPVGTPVDSTQAAAVPAVTVGESWTYSVRDGFTALDRGTERYRVQQVSAGNITVARERSGSEVEDVQVYDSQWNWLKRPATNLQSFDYSPAYQAFDFPLAPGKQWDARLFATDPRDGRRFPVRVEGKVIGWERIKVPAGEFDALKIVRVVYVDYWELSVRGSSRIIEQEWYAPAVKQSVRRETTSRYWSWLGELDSGFVRVRGKDGGGPQWMQDDWLVYELVSHQAR
jgi:hypothetical protein